MLRQKHGGNKEDIGRRIKFGRHCPADKKIIEQHETQNTTASHEHKVEYGVNDPGVGLSLSGGRCLFWGTCNGLGVSHSAYIDYQGVSSSILFDLTKMRTKGPEIRRRHIDCTPSLCLQTSLEKYKLFVKCFCNMAQAVSESL